MSGHAPDAFWQQFPYPWEPEEGETLRGRIVNRRSIRGPGGDIPELLIRTDEGELYNVLVGSRGLLQALKDLKPAVGDLIKIRYKGAVPSSVSGYKPTKQWAVAVRGDVTETGP